MDFTLRPEVEQQAALDWLAALLGERTQAKALLRAVTDYPKVCEFPHGCQARVAELEAVVEDWRAALDAVKGRSGKLYWCFPLTRG